MVVEREVKEGRKEGGRERQRAKKGKNGRCPGQEEERLECEWPTEKKLGFLIVILCDKRERMLQKMYLPANNNLIPYFKIKWHLHIFTSARTHVRTGRGNFNIQLYIVAYAVEFFATASLCVHLAAEEKVTNNRLFVTFSSAVKWTHRLAVAKNKPHMPQYIVEYLNYLFRFERVSGH